MALERKIALTLMVLAAPGLALAQVPAASHQPEAAKPAAASPIAPMASQGRSADDYPTGAPRDDYEFTAWCYGVLRRHMELYDEVKPELEAISKRWKTEEEDRKSYAEQIAAGRDALAGFRRAITLAERASPQPINVRGAAAIEQGRQMWNQMGTVDKNWQAYSWMNWELPEKCMKVSAALEDKALLMAPALKANTSAPAPAGKSEPKKVATNKDAD